MPLVSREEWTFACGVCGLELRCLPGTYPDDWRRLTIGRRDAISYRSAFDRDAWRAARFEDWVCSPGCATAAVARSFDPPRQRQLRAHELAAVAARVVQ
ncbi:MAG: hypothetical protein IT352_15480 [Gemmatimonadales bacterium]|nr:hypothetical protein [Gemmatimonadales bacterium]